MINNLSRVLAFKLYNHKVINRDDIDLLSYSFFLIFSYVIYAFICLSCGLIFHCVLESIIFYFFFSLLRMFTGGFHASSEIKCFLISSIMIFISTYLITVLSDNRFNSIFYALLSLSFIIILIFAPIDNDTKKIDKTDRKKYRKIAIIILFVYLLTILIFTYYRKAISFSIGLTIIFEGLFISLEKIRYQIKKFALSKQK